MTTKTNDEPLTKEECFRILELYRGWNLGQKSISHAFGGPRTPEDDVLDSRRALIRAAQDRLAVLAESGKE